MTTDQLKQGIVALEEQGAPPEDIQAWIDIQKAPEPPKPTKGKGGVAGAVGNFGIGVTKGVGKTAIGLGQLALRGAKYLPFGEGYKDAVQGGIDTGEDLKREFAPKNASQSAGLATEQIAEMFIPGGAAARAGKLATSIPRIANLAGKTGKAVRFGTNLLAKAGTDSVLFGAQKAAQEGQFNREAKDAGVAGGLTSTAFSLLGPLGRAIGKGTNSMAIGTANSALGETVAKRLPGVKAGAPSLGEDVLKEGFKLSTTKGLQKQFQAVATKLDDDLTTFLKSKSGTVSKKELRPYLTQLFKDAKNAFGEKGARTEALKRIIDDIPDDMTFARANEAKRELYQAAKNAFTNPNAGITPQGQKAVARGIKETIEKKTVPKVAQTIAPETHYLAAETTKGGRNLLSVPDSQLTASELRRKLLMTKPNDTKTTLTTLKDLAARETTPPAQVASGVSPVKEINRRLGIASRASDRLANRVAQSENKRLLNVTDLLSGGVGMAAAGPFGGIGLPLARRLLDSPAGKLAIAKSLYGANQGFGKASSTELYKALQRVLGTKGVESLLP